MLVWQTAAAESTVRLRAAQGGRLAVPVRVNGKGPYSFLFDTGATTTMLGSRLAKKLALSPQGTARVNTFAGNVDIAVLPVESLAVGPHWLGGLEVLCADLRKSFGLDSGIEGILGQDFLSRFNYFLDRRDLTMTIEEDGELEAHFSGERTPIESRGGKPYVLARSDAGEGAALRLMLDSGIPYPVFYEDAASRLGLLPVPGAEQDLAARSDLGRRQLTARVLPLLSIGPVTLRNLTVYVTPRREAGRPEDGILPLSLFDSIYVNNLHAFVIFNPQRGLASR